MNLHFSEDVVARANTLLERDHIKPDDEHLNIWWVMSLHSGNLYRVQADWNPLQRTLSWITCTCPHGLNTGAGQTHCYHAAAVLLMLKREKEEMDDE